MRAENENIAGSKDYLAYRESFAWLFELNPGNIVVQQLTQDYLLEIFSYEQEKVNPETGYLTRYAAIKALLKNRAGEVVRKLKSIDGHFFAQLVNHSDGKQYLLYNTDLYGYSVMDMSSFTAVDYVPYQSFAGSETFIWCEKHYSPVSNLLVVDGCYWACPWGLEFYDFSHPMQLPLPKYGDSLHLESKLGISIDDDVSFAGFTKAGECMINCLDRDGQAVQKIVRLHQLQV